MASLPRIGETISGFTVTELGTIHMLGASFYISRTMTGNWVLT